MAPQSLDFRRIRRRIRRTLNYGSRTTKGLHLPLSEFVVSYFDKHMPFDYMTPETSTSISHRGFADPCTLVVAMVYLDRLRDRNRKFFESSSPVDLYLPALVLASKYLHDSDVDERVANCSWAEAAEMDNDYLNNLEWDFVNEMDWDCMVQSKMFDQYLSELEKYVSSDFLRKNDFGTYNELRILSDGIKGESCWELLHSLISSIGLISLFYSMAVASMITTPLVYQSLTTGHLPTLSNVTSGIVGSQNILFSFEHDKELDDGRIRNDEESRNRTESSLLFLVMYDSSVTNDEVPDEASSCYEEQERNPMLHLTNTFTVENRIGFDHFSQLERVEAFNITNHLWGAVEIVC